ncbi:MAG: PLP-dependent aminotransferase family protein [Actinomycetales bacterium]
MAQERAWRPSLLAPERPAYLALADAIASDVARGRLAPGDRLPTHRALAAELGVTVRTVARGYAEAERRGLIGGEVGRGTYIREGFGAAAPRPDAVDLASLHPPLAAGPPPGDRLAATLRAIAADPVALARVAETEHSADDPGQRAAAAAWLTHGAFAPAANDVLLTAGAQHAVTVCLLALATAGTKVATTELTNPGLLAAARALGVPLRPVDSDADGMSPEALDEACAKDAVSVVHLQPTLDNPLAHTMTAERREALAQVARRRNLWVLEDDPLGPLVADRPDPVASFAPERTCHIASAAKVLALGLRVGVLAAPAPAFPQLAAAVRASTWLTAPLLAEVFARWVRDGLADDIVQQRRDASRERNGLARRLLTELTVSADPDAPHLWVELPTSWSVGSFAVSARDAGILIAPGDDYLADRHRPVRGVRVGLNAEVSDDDLQLALVTLNRLAAGGPTTS